MNLNWRRGRGNIQLQYLFDLEGFKGILREYVRKNEESHIKEAETMFSEAVSHDNPPIRYDPEDRIGTLASAVIGGHDEVCLSLRETKEQAIARGVLNKR